MDSLLANYASSDEDDHDQQPPPRQQLVPPAKSVELQPAKSVEQKDDDFMPKSGPGLFNSLPPPKSSLFNSLPPPKSQSLTNPNPHSQFDDKLPENSNPKPSSNSLFSSLPLPKSTEKVAMSASSLSNVLPLPKSGSKTVVQFRPPTVINPSFDDDDDDDEDERERQRKRSKEAMSASSSLSSILPAPRSSATLGAASGTGRRSMLETSTPTSSGSAVSDAVADPNVGYLLNQHSELSYDYSSFYRSGDAVVDQNVGHLGDQSNEIYDHSQSASFGRENYAYYGGYGDGTSTGSGAGSDAGVSSEERSFGAVDCSYGEGQHVEYANYSGGYGDYGNTAQYENTWTNAAALPEGLGMAGSALLLSGKKGKKDAPPQIIEVKQDELMKNRPREDQVKLTGIAFGPAYQSAPSKGKPTKLHKRKHQIGALYFDMRQRELELAERRAKGFLTKAQTQAKYGWS